MRPSIQAYLALGTNIGEREQYMREAIQTLHATDGMAVTKVSAVYQTQPVGFLEQPTFLNMVVQITTSLSPLDLLARTSQIEQEMGRIRTVRFGPRLIDIDILLYGHEHIHLPTLTIPHPAMLARAFVLVPLSDIWEGGQLPGSAQKIDEVIQQTEDSKGVEKWGVLIWESASGHFVN